MVLLGFKGVHPAALLLFPLALLLVFGGLFLLHRYGALLSPGQRSTYRKVRGLLCLVAVAVFIVLSSSEKKYLLLAYACVFAAFVVQDAVLGARLLAARFAPGDSPMSHRPGRRRFLAASVFLATGGVTAAADMGNPGDSGHVQARHIRLPGPPGMRAGRELRISLLSDLHAGFFLPQEYLTQALGHVRAFAPDVIFFGGDLVEHELSAMHEAEAFFQALTAQAPVYSVLGNHDCYIDPGALAAWQRGQGIRVLRGETVALDGPWGRVHLCGLPDLTENDFSFAALKAAPDPAAALVLVHHPGVALRIPAPLAPWLTMSGHTHGGQICFPGIGGLVNQADRRILPGLCTVDGRRVLLTPGLGYSGLPVRLSCPPEVTNLSLV